MDVEERDILRGLGLGAVALLSAALSATLVIGLGSALLSESSRPAATVVDASPDMSAARR